MTILDGTIAGASNYLWNTSATSQSITVNQSGTYSVTGGIPMTNIVQNGDFEGGTTAASNNFTTGYAVGSGGAWGLLSNAGEWAITTAANLVHNNFPGCTDHTTGATNMFVANGASVANTVVWSQTVPVTANTDYLFSFWAMRVSNDPNARSICDAVLTPTPGKIPFSLCSELLEEGLVVTDQEVKAAVKFAFKTLKLVVEPGGAVALAAVLHNKLPTKKKAIALTLSGGNVDPSTFKICLES